MHPTLRPSRPASLFPAVPTSIHDDGTHGPSTAEREFIDAILAYKKSSGRLFPTWSEVLEVAQNLGYTKAGAGAGA